MLNVGRDLSPAQRLALAAADVARIQGQIAGVGAFSTTGGGAAVGGASAARKAALEQELAGAKQVMEAAQKRAELEERATINKAEQNRLQALGIAFDKQGDEFKTKAAKRDEELNKARIEGNELIKNGLLTQIELNQRLSDIRAKYKESGVAGTGQNEVAAIRARVKAQTEYLAALQAQIAGDGKGGEIEKLTDGEKLVIKINEELKTSINGVARAQKEKALAAAQDQAAVDKSVVAAEKQLKAIKETEATLDKQVDAERKATASIRDQAIQQEAVNLNFGKSKTAIEQATLAQMNLRLAEADAFDNGDPAYIASLRAKTEAQERYTKALQDGEYIQAKNKLTEAGRVSQEESTTIALELSLLGQTQEVRERIIAQRRVEVSLAKELADIDKRNLGEGPAADAKREELKAQARANSLIDSQNAANKVVLDQWQRTADSINSSLTDALLRGFESGKSFAENFRDTLVNMFKTTVLRPIISAVMSPVSNAVGGVTNGIVGGATQAMGLGSYGASGVGSGLTSAFMGGYTGAGAMAGYSIAGTAGTATMGGILAPAGTAVATDLTGATVIAGAAGGGAGTGGLLAGMQAGLTAIGPVGWIALAAIALYAAFGNKGGGPKNIGSFGSGDLATDFTRSDSTAASNVAAKQGVDAILATYKEATQSLGLTAKDLQVGLLFSIDDKGAGDAMTALVAQAFIDGKAVFDRENSLSGSDAYKNVGRSPEELAAATKEATADILLAALKETDMPTKLAEYFAKLDPLTLNAEQIGAAVAAATSAQNLFNIIGNLGTAFQTVADLSVEAINSLAAAYGSPEKFAADLQSFYANFTPAATQRSNAVNQVVTGLNAAGVNVTADQVASATAEDVSRLMATLIDMGAAGKDGAFALLRFNGVIKQIIDTAEKIATGPTVAELRTKALNLKTPGLVTDAERQNVTVANIQSTLSGAGLDFSTGQLLNATAEQVRAVYFELERVGNTNAASAVLDVADALLGLKGSAANSAQVMADFAKAAAKAMADNLANAITAAQDRLTSARNTLVEAYNREASALQAVIDKNLAYAENLKQARLAIFTGPQSALSGAERANAARSALRGANPENAAGLVSSYLDAVKSQSSSRLDFLREQAKGADLLRKQEDIARGAASAASQQLSATTSLVGSMVDLNGGIVSLRDAILGVKTAQGNVDVANLNQSTAGLSQSDAGAVFDSYYRQQIEAKGGSWADFEHQRDYQNVSIEEYLRSLPGYATGGSPTGLSWVGEQGKELVDFSAPRVYSNSESNGIAASSAATVDEIRALREELAKVTANTAVSAKESTSLRQWIQKIVAGTFSLRTRTTADQT
jgi:hypothetical protein